MLLLYDPLRKLNSANLALQQAMAIGQRVLELFHEPNDIVEAEGAVVLPEFTERIVFDDITVRIGDRTVLDHLCLEVHRGETVAFVGPSGSGKTTLVSLLPRLLDPDAGRVTLDGHDIRGLTLASLRGLVSFVPQRTFLFDDTIRANIALGRPDVPFERVEAVARAASAHAFIAARPEGYDAVVGEGGVCSLEESGSASPWPVRSSATRPFWSSTRRPPSSTPSPKPLLPALCGQPWPAGPCWSSPIA